MKHKILLLAAVTICSFGFTPRAQAYSGEAADESVFGMNFDNAYELIFASPGTPSGTITLTYPYFYLSSEVVFYPDGGSPMDISVQAPYQGSEVTITYVGPDVYTAPTHYTLRIATGVPGGTEITYFYCYITINPV